MQLQSYSEYTDATFPVIFWQNSSNSFIGPIVKLFVTAKGKSLTIGRGFSKRTYGLIRLIDVSP